MLSCVSLNKIDLPVPPQNYKPNENDPPTYTWLKENVFSICAYCHPGRYPNLFEHSGILSVVMPVKPLESRLYFMVASGRMPLGRGRLPKDKIWAIYRWIENGAKDN